MCGEDRHKKNKNNVYISYTRLAIAWRLWAASSAQQKWFKHFLFLTQLLTS